MTEENGRRRIPRRVWARALLLVLTLVVGLVIVRWTPVGDSLNEERLVELITSIRGVWWAPPLLVFLYTVFAPLALPAAPLMVAGAAFGPVNGFIYNMTGLFAGAASSYFLARALGRDFVTHIAGRRMRRAEHLFKRHGFWPLVQTRFLPIPFTAISFGAALSGVPPAMFLSAALVGLAPSTFIHSFFIAKLIETTGRDRIPYLVAYGASFVVFNLMIGIPWIVNQRRRRRRYLELTEMRRARANTEAPAAPRTRDHLIAFSFSNLFRFTAKWLTAPGWSIRRAAIVAAYVVFLPLILLAVWTGLLADRLFYPGHRRRRVEEPLFIIGNFRSGTTLMHRLLAKDEQRFTTMKMWQILFAPSITLRKIVGLLVRIDRVVGSPGHRVVAWIDRDWDRRNPMHQASLNQPEEDDYLLLHTWSALTIGLSSGLLDEAGPYTYFDQQLPRSDRQRIMEFYRRCVQRHVHAEDRGGSQTYLAKNPALTPKIKTALEYFPDAKIVFMVRDPRDTIPSFLSMMEMSWRIVGANPEGPDLRNYLVDMARHWYRYPPEVLGDLPPDRFATVSYDDLVSSPAATVRSLYQQLGFEIDAGYEAILDSETGKAQDYRSRHHYSATEMGLDPDQIAGEFADVIDRYGFGSASPRRSETEDTNVDAVTSS